MKKKKSKNWAVGLTALLSVALLVGTSSAPATVKAASNMVTDYEVKLLLNPAVVLSTDHKLKSNVLTAFSMPSTVTKMNILFMDTDAEDIYTNGWIPRVRKMEGESGFELTYKKRYAITDGNITAALNLANAEGFDSTDTNYDSQVEWGYQNKTLSISNDKTKSKSGYSGMDLPSASDSRSLLKSNIPGKMDDWLYGGWLYGVWGSDRLDDSN